MNSPVSSEGAETIDLGAPIRVFRPRRWWVRALLCAVLTGGLIPTTLHVKADEENNKGPAVPIFAVLTAASAGGLMLCAIMALVSLNQRTVIHERGVTVPRLSGTTAVPFEQIDEVYFHMAKAIMGQEAWIVTRAGQKVDLPAMILGLFDAYEMLCEGISPRALAALRERLATGEPMKFGKHLLVVREGLNWKGRFLPWDAVNGLFWGVENYQRGNALATRSALGIGNRGCDPLPTKSIPNLPILLEFAETDHQIKVERGTNFFR